MFTIDQDNVIALGGSGAPFVSATELLAIADDRKLSRESLEEIWNGFVGAPPFTELKPVKKFRNRGFACERIFAVIQRLTPEGERVAVVKSEPEAAVETAPVSRNPSTVAKSTKDRAVKAAGKSTEAIRLMSRVNGATAAELQEKLGWLPHTLRGWVSTLRSKRGISVLSEKHETKGRIYRIAA